MSISVEMSMSVEFATTVALVIPVILLALGAEARELDERTRPQRGMDVGFVKHMGRTEKILEDFPDISPDWTPEQVRAQWANYNSRRKQVLLTRSGLKDTLPPRALLVATLWGLEIMFLGVVEIGNLVWLAGNHVASTNSAILALLSVSSCALGILLLFATPVFRLLWYPVPTEFYLTSKLPDSYWQLVERKFGLPADASVEDRQTWIEAMRQPSNPK